MTVDFLLATEMKILALRIADWPTAIVCHQRLHRLSFSDGNDRLGLENRHCRLSNWVHEKAFFEIHAGLIAGTRL
jgi:hypothetical protein